ncbi:Mobile element protein [Richelia intracellularis]|nr:Mobile element protein [Richelia intracellularis]
MGYVDSTALAGNFFFKNHLIRTFLDEETLSATDRVKAYKNLSQVEQAFRSYKTVNLKVRPIYHDTAERVKSHIFLCMLSYYYVEWHML